MDNQRILYPAAKDENGNLIEAEKLTKEEAVFHQYRCLRCNDKMIPILKNVDRVKHFRHLGAQCRYNDYLHSYAEEVFIAEYQTCIKEGLPFYLEYSAPVRCNRSCVLKEHQDCKERFNTVTKDLTKEYPFIQREARVKTHYGTSRIPDILLSNEDGRKTLWLEICVTHEVPPEKQSEGRIIEVKISSVEDLSMFREHHIRQCNNKEKWIHLYGIGNVLIDAPMHNTPPCDKFFIFEVMEGSTWGQGRITATIPKETDALLYRAILRLNWHESHSGDGYPFAQRTKEELQGICYRKYRTGRIDDFRIDSLYVQEFRKHDNTHQMYQYPIYQKRSVTPSRNETPAQLDRQEPITVNWIDLGLPSGTLWADCDGSQHRTQGAVSLPTRKDIEELKQNCKQSVSDDGNHLILRGPNGNTITLNDGKYLLNDRGRDFVYCLNIYSLIGENYLHIIEEDFGAKTNKRFVRR